jgi:tRNA-dihydrouridine synthase B
VQIGSLNIPGVAVLAPMAGITDLNFRLLCREFGCGLVYTELVSASTLLRGVRRSLQLVETTEVERPVGVQLFGPEPGPLAEAARWVVDHVPCDLIDLNMGCPVAKVVSKGAGAALMRDPDLVQRLVGAVVDAVDVPVTAKTRSGWTDREINAIEVAQAVEAAGGAGIAIHARTRAQRHEGPVDWELLAAIKAAVHIPVIGNGGILDAQTALRMRAQTGVDAVMVGRGAMGNPWIFEQIDDAWHGRDLRHPSWAERLGVIERHLDAAIAAFDRWAHKRKERLGFEERAMRFMRGHLVRYTAGLPGGDAFKRRVNDLATREAILAGLQEVLGEEAAAAHPDLSRERFGPTPKGRPAAA